MSKNVMLKALLKTVLFIVLLGVIVDSLNAQEIKVMGFQESTKDLSARTKPRQDLNGNDCALIKVQMVSSDVSFSGSIMGDVEFKSNEYWVYMPEGSKRLKVVHPNYLPLEVNFADYDVPPLKGKTTYLLALSLGDLSGHLGEFINFEYNDEDVKLLRKRLLKTLSTTYKNHLAKFENTAYYNLSDDDIKALAEAYSNFYRDALQAYNHLKSVGEFMFSKEVLIKEWVQAKQYYYYLLYTKMVANSPGHENDFEGKHFRYYDKEDTMKLRKRIQEAVLPAYKKHLAKYERIPYTNSQQLEQFAKDDIQFGFEAARSTRRLKIECVGEFSEELFINEYNQTLMYYSYPFYMKFMGRDEFPEFHYYIDDYENVYNFY